MSAYGVRIATVWQSIAQMRDRYGEAKDTIMGASTDKLFLGPITDRTTREEVINLLGRFAAAGIDFIKTEHLYNFDGQAGYSAGQGQ